MFKLTQRNLQNWYKQLVKTDNKIIRNSKHNKETMWVDSDAEHLLLVSYDKDKKRAYMTTYSPSGFHLGYKKVEAGAWK